MVSSMWAWASRWRSTGSPDFPLAAGERHDAVELAAEAELVAEQRHAPLEGQGGERDTPPVADAAHHVLDLRAGTVEEHLVELAGPVIWLIGRTSTPGWSIGTSR